MTAVSDETVWDDETRALIAELKVIVHKEQMCMVGPDAKEGVAEKLRNRGVDINAALKSRA
ncbi:MAG: hypothetical protein ABI382_05915 [Nakamurella sp.]